MSQLHVALLQLRAFDLHEHAAAWDELLRRIDEAGAGNPDLIVTPEASYPAYFLGSRAAYDAAGLLSDAEVETALAERARRFGCTIAAGLVRRDPASGALHNALVLFGPNGMVIGRYAKAFLWHFDRDWFVPGDRFPVFEVAGVPVGLTICADQRLPEIARTYAVSGARLLIVATAWVASGREAAALTSPQVEYIVPTRALENGCWVVAAGKVGTEAGSIIYAGRSGAVSPAGRWVAQAPADQPGVLTVTINLEEASGPPVARRPALYADAALPGSVSAAAAQAAAPLAVGPATTRVAAATIATAPSAVELAEAVRRLVRAVAAQGAALVVLPDFAGLDPRGIAHREFLPIIEALASETGTLIAVGLAERDNGRTYKTAFLVGADSLLAAHRQTHLTAAEAAAGFTAGDAPPPIVETPFAHMGLLAGAEGLAPELARGLRLRGAEVIVWSAAAIGPDSGGGPGLRGVARTRANENRCYIVAAGGPSTAGGAYIVDPTGAVLAEPPAGLAMAISADINRAVTRWQQMAPGANPIRDRHPERFAALFTPPSPEARASTEGP